MGIEAAIIGAAVIGAGTTIYAQREQEKAVEAAESKRALAEAEETKRREEETRRAKAEAAAIKAENERIARETKPEEEALQEIQFGVEGLGSTGTGATQEFLIPKVRTLGGTGTGRSGLGFKV